MPAMFTEPLPAIALLLTCALIAAGTRLHVVLSRARSRVAVAEQLAAARGRCLSMAAQELRGPGLALMAEAALWNPARRRAGEEPRLEGMAQQLLRLADDLADFATEGSPRTLHEAPVVIGLVVDAAVAAIAAQIQPGRRHWNIDPALRRVAVQADKRALEGALAGLLRRAARHSRDGDVITIRHVLGSETVAIIVEDEGDGLGSQDLLTDLAGPHQASATRGLDLGLSLARSLAAAHGGDIRLETAPGIGARAWLTLPRRRLLPGA